MDFLIFRHGETFFSKTDTPYGDKIETAEILEEGKPDISRLADYINNISTDANFASPYFRCKQTVEIVSQITKKAFTFDDRIGEFRSDKGETMDQLFGRLSNFLEEVKSKNLKSVAICTHGYGISALRQLILKGSPDLDDINNYPRTGILVKISGNSLEYKDFN